MVEQTVEVSAKTIDTSKQMIMQRHQHEILGFEAQIAAERERQAAAMRARLAQLRSQKQALG